MVRVSVYGEAELTKSYSVDDAGALSLPLVGPVPVRGKTTQATAKAITAALAQGYIREPSVAVEIETYRPFFIQGEVDNAGQFAYVYGMTVRARDQHGRRLYRRCEREERLCLPPPGQPDGAWRGRPRFSDLPRRHHRRAEAGPGAVTLPHICLSPRANCARPASGA